MGRDSRVKAVIDLKAIRQNLFALKQLCGQKMVLATVKANAYGHGAERVASYLEKDVDYFGVATVSEGVALRKCGIKKPILLLGYISEASYTDVILNDITVTIYNLYQYLSFAKFLSLTQRKAKVHVAVDTGMSRLGFAYDTQLEDIISVCKCENFVIEGIFTHFACSDKKKSCYDAFQKKNFRSVLKKLKEKGINIPIIHTDNTSAIINGSLPQGNMVRPGIGLYGVNPILDDENTFIPAMELSSVIADIRLIPRGRGVSYGKSFCAKTKTKIATVAIGYADGLPRRLSNKGKVIINNSFAPIVGKVCMDYIMVDITNLSCAKIGDKVIIIGKSQDKIITVDEVAKICDTIPYEIFTQITERTEKLFVDCN